MTRERSPMLDLFDLQDALRHHAVWDHNTDLFSSDGQRRLYPRFIAVIEDEGHFKALELSARAIKEALQDEGQSDRWVPTFFNEVWDYATLRVADAYRSQRCKDGYLELVLKVCKESEWPEEKAMWEEHMKALGEKIPLKRHDYRVVTEGGMVEATLKIHAKVPFTVRQASGSHYRMYGVSSDGVQHEGVKCGIVVLRGFTGVVQVNTPRKRRSDMKKELYFIPALKLIFYP